MKSEKIVAEVHEEDPVCLGQGRDEDAIWQLLSVGGRLVVHIRSELNSVCQLVEMSSDDFSKSELQELFEEWRDCDWSLSSDPEIPRPKDMKNKIEEWE